MSVFEDLSRTCAHIAHKRPDWIEDPSLNTFVGRSDGPAHCVEAVMGAVRSYLIEPDASDRAVCALADLVQENPDALTVLLEALSPILQGRLGRSLTEDYRADALGDLVFVVCDAIERKDLAGRSRLAHRLVNRAHNRTHKRARRQHAQAWDPDWFGDVSDRATPPGFGNVADVAIARADLAGFGRAVDDAIRRGRLPASGWETFRDHRLRRLVRDASGSTASQRALAARFARSLRPIADVFLAGHAA